MSIFDRIKSALGLGAKFRNKPQGMAWVRGIKPSNGGAETLNGRAVKTVRIDAETGLWQIDPPQAFICTADGLFGLSQRPVFKGQPVCVTEISDDLLEPWKEDGGSDKEVRELYSPDKKVTRPEKNKELRNA
jgi:hypothetical protein